MFMHRLVVADVADPGSRPAQNAAMHSGAAVSDARLRLRVILDPRFSYPDFLRPSSFLSTSVSSVNRDDGNSEIEGKAAKGREASRERREFQIRGSNHHFKNVTKNVLTRLGALH